MCAPIKFCESGPLTSAFWLRLQYSDPIHECKRLTQHLTNNCTESCAIKCSRVSATRIEILAIDLIAEALKKFKCCCNGIALAMGLWLFRERRSRFTPAKGKFKGPNMDRSIGTVGPETINSDGEHFLI
jgi:hypothetical protein